MRMEREELGAAGNLRGDKGDGREKLPLGRPQAGRRRATRMEPHPAPPACRRGASSSPLQHTRILVQH